MGTKFSNRDRKKGGKMSNRDIARELMKQYSEFMKEKPKPVKKQKKGFFRKFKKKKSE